LNNIQIKCTVPFLRRYFFLLSGNEKFAARRILAGVARRLDRSLDKLSGGFVVSFLSRPAGE
jgi:hypothetical protein